MKRHAPLTIALGTCAALLLFAGCSRPATSQDPAAGSRPVEGTRAAAGRRSPVISVQAAGVRFGPLVVVHETAGSVVPATQSQVATQLAGVVRRVNHRAGDWVKEGETVVQLDDSQLRLAVRSAESALENAKINLSIGKDTTSQASPKLSLQVQSAQSSLEAATKNYDAAEALYKLGGASGSQLDSAKSQLQQAQANLEAAKAALDQNRKADTQNLAQLQLAVDQATNQLEQARLNLRNASIRAPFAGQLSAVNVTPGMYVSQNIPAFIVVSRDLEIDFSVPPTDSPNLRLGMKIGYTYGGRRHAIRIKQNPSAPINGVVPLAASFSDAGLPYGTVGTVSYSLTLGEGVIVPIASLNSSENRNYVFVVRDGKASVANVTIIAESGTSAAVSGLADGDEVIVSPPPGLLPGSAVRTVGNGGRNGGGNPGGRSAAGNSGSASGRAANP